jgi:hypothetical protein
MKRMGRPAVNPRRHEVHVRVSADELRKISANAKASGQASLSEFFRQRVLGPPSREAADGSSPGHRREGVTTSASSRIRRGSR